VRAPSGNAAHLVVEVAEERPGRAAPHGAGVTAAVRVQQGAARARLLAARELGHIHRILARAQRLEAHPAARCL